MVFTKVRHSRPHCYQNGNVFTIETKPHSNTIARKLGLLLLVAIVIPFYYWDRIGSKDFPAIAVAAPVLILFAVLLPSLLWEIGGTTLLRINRTELRYERWFFTLPLSRKSYPIAAISQIRPVCEFRKGGESEDYHQHAISFRCQGKNVTLLSGIDEESAALIATQMRQKISHRV